MLKKNHNKFSKANIWKGNLTFLILPKQKFLSLILILGVTKLKIIKYFIIIIEYKITITIKVYTHGIMQL